MRVLRVTRGTVCRGAYPAIGAPPFLWHSSFVYIARPGIGAPSLGTSPRTQPEPLAFDAGTIANLPQCRGVSSILDKMKGLVSGSKKEEEGKAKAEAPEHAGPRSTFDVKTTDFSQFSEGQVRK